MKKFLFAAISAMLLLTGCATGSLQGNVYSRHEARQAYTVQAGTLESIRMVRIEGTRSGVGTIAGGLIGGLAGNSIGGGNGRKIMTILGVLAGARVGAEMEQGASATQAVELLIKLDSGQRLVVVQELSDEQLYLGQRVTVISNGSTQRVTRG